ncbi:unnamed protein product [Cladocopium goreaui]|uniref:Uncharacterized protein n=1 Tax=Cladocopium goreaui TaxID=2562237 RepID=A0A9P1BRW9_9DINO|nr:unnamed protein product [Cladocopium goreaui]
MTSETTSVNCSYVRLKVWCASLKLKLIMSIVLNASLLPKGNDIITVAIAQSFNGEDVCSFDLNNGTLADLEKTLCDPRGPMFRCLPRSSLHFYTEKEPLRALDLQLQVCSFGSLVIQYKAPDVGKFLEAMQNNKFDPSSANFEMTWTAAEAPAVSAYQTEFMIDQVLSGLPTHADSREHFVRIFGKLTAMGESWIVPRDAMLGKYFSDGRHFKHRLCQHWLEMARDASTSKISEATPIILLKRGDDGRLIGCAVLGDSFPRNFDDGMQRELNDWVLYPDFKWQNVSHALLSLDWDPQEGLALLQNLPRKIQSRRAPAQFTTLQTQEVNLMVHVQLRLSYLGVAEVQGSINAACVEVLAELLEYKLKIVKFQSVADLETEMKGFEGDAQHRGTLVLVTDLPASTGKIFAGSHRMVLCYNAEE